MKKTLFLALAAIILASVSASAQFRWGIRAGMTVNEIKFEKSALESDNRTGFTGGLTGEFTIPVIGLNFDASLLYTNRSFSTQVYTTDDKSYSEHFTRGYINIPVNLKYKFNFPLVSKVFAPFITTGPDFSFLVTKKNVEGAVKNKSFDTAWTLGAGFELFSHLQLAANYGWGLTKTVSGPDALYSAKNRCWTVTASYYF